MLFASWWLRVWEVESEVELPADGSKVVLVWRGSAWVSGSS